MTSNFGKRDNSSPFFGFDIVQGKDTGRNGKQKSITNDNIGMRELDQRVVEAPQKPVENINGDMDKVMRGQLDKQADITRGFIDFQKP